MQLQEADFGITIPFEKFVMESPGVFTLKLSDLTPGQQKLMPCKSINMDRGRGHWNIFSLQKIERDQGEFVCALYQYPYGPWFLKVTVEESIEL